MTNPDLICVALETSSRAGSVALRVGASGATRVAKLDEGRSHGSDLIPAIDELVRAESKVPRDLNVIAVGTGPGSYTGLRVGAATALGLARGTGAVLIGVPSFEAIAYGHLAAGERGAIVRGAFGGQIYLGVYERTEDGLIEQVAPLSCPFADVPALTSAASEKGLDVWLGDQRGADGVREVMDVDVRIVETRAVDLLEVALQRRARGAATGEESVKPLYLRPFEAKNRRR